MKWYRVSSINVAARLDSKRPWLQRVAAADREILIADNLAETSGEKKPPEQKTPPVSEVCVCALSSAALRLQIKRVVDPDVRMPSLSIPGQTRRVKVTKEFLNLLKRPGSV